MSSVVSDQSFEKMWWVSISGKAEGPYALDVVRDGLRAHRFPLNTHACPADGGDWRLVQDWPEFADVKALAPPPPPGSQVDSWVTSSRLPLMANLICVYALVLSPSWWVISLISTAVIGFTYEYHSQFLPVEIVSSVIHGVLSLIAICALAWGGFRLRSLRRSGPLLIQVSILSSCAMTGVMILLMIALSLMANESDFTATTPAQMVLGLTFLLIGFAFLVFELTAVVWLWLYAKSLHLTN